MLIPEFHPDAYVLTVRISHFMDVCLYKHPFFSQLLDIMQVADRSVVLLK